MTQNSDRQELAIRYVLGTLSDDEKAQLDHRFFSNDAAFEELEIAEEELIDRYVRQDLSAENARQMESALATSPRLRERVEFARILARKVEAHETITDPVEKRRA